MTADHAAHMSMTTASGAPHPGGFFRRFLRLAGPYWRSEDRWRTGALTAALVVLTLGQVVVPVLMNLWSADLFDALEQKSMDRFVVQLVALLGIIAASIAITGMHLWIKRRLQVGWRRWLTRRLIEDWMDQGRHYQVTHMPGEHDNPDGRIAEDIRITTEAAVDLAHSLFYCLLLLVSFTQILWSLSGTLTLDLFGGSLPVPGHMVWLALLYAGAGTTAALLLGRPLVRAVNRRQSFEANFRFGLVRARENSEAIALLHGEADERRRFSELFRGIEKAWGRQTQALTRIFMFTSGYGLMATAFPIVVTAPRYIAGAITLGALVQIGQAFQQMTAALSWPVDNLAKAAEWRASVERVLALNDAIEDVREDVGHVDQNTIVVDHGGRPGLAFRGMCVAEPDGTVLLSGLDAEILPGERVLISGDTAAAVKLLKVVAGLWPWGCGHVQLPDDKKIHFMPQRPYLPHGPLRRLLTYPRRMAGVTDEQMAEALRRVGLDRLVGQLDHTDSWDHALSPGEQQRLGFARLLLQRPDWICLEQATGALDPEGEEAMMRLLEDEFPDATILTVGHRAALEAYHHRKLSLERADNGMMLVKHTRLRREAARRHHQKRRGRSWRQRLLGAKTPH